MATYCTALVPCESAKVVAETGRHIILGTFDTIAAPAFPHTVARFCLYVCLWGSEPDSTFLIGFFEPQKQGDPGERLFKRTRLDVQWGPTGGVECAYDVYDTTFKSPGRYMLRLLSGDTLLMERPIFVFPAAGGAANINPATHG